MTLPNEFRKWQKIHPNPMTPELKKTRQADGKIIELAKSRRDEFYGVAVWEKEEETCEYCDEDREKHAMFSAVDHDLNKSFHDREEARNYFEKLKKHFDDKLEEDIKEALEEMGE